jgi:hypothetical protein
MNVLCAWVLAMNYSAKVSQSDAAGLELLHQGDRALSPVSAAI